ncbi:hypothetical protein I6E16_10555, partial [Ligilactobacillus salivarius]|nr:hypothetical protein [Ligilactobacillus salivarius]
MINKTDFYKYKGKVFFNVEDPFGYKHKEVEVLAICQLPQSKDMGLVTHDLTVSGNNATSL